MYLLNNVHYKQQNLNITQILTLVLSHSSFYQVFFLNISKQLSSLSSILWSTLSKYFIPMTKNVWLPTTPKFDLFPRKTQGQLDHQIHFLPPLFSLFSHVLSLFPSFSRVATHWFPREALAFQGPPVHSTFGYYIVGQLIHERVCTVLLIAFFKFEAIHKHNRATENVSRKQNQKTSCITESSGLYGQHLPLTLFWARGCARDPTGSLLTCFMYALLSTCLLLIVFLH